MALYKVKRMTTYDKREDGEWTLNPLKGEAISKEPLGQSDDVPATILKIAAELRGTNDKLFALAKSIHSNKDKFDVEMTYIETHD